MELHRLALAVPCTGPEPSPASLGLLAGLSSLRWRVQHFRSRACPMGTEAVGQATGLPGRHLDAWLMPPEVCRRVFARGARGRRPRAGRGDPGGADGDPQLRAPRPTRRPPPDRRGARPAHRGPALLPAVGGPAPAQPPPGRRRRPDRRPGGPRGLRPDRLGGPDGPEEAGDRRRRGPARGPPGPGRVAQGRPGRRATCSPRWPRASGGSPTSPRSGPWPGAGRSRSTPASPALGGRPRSGSPTPRTRRSAATSPTPWRPWRPSGPSWSSSPPCGARPCPRRPTW